MPETLQKSRPFNGHDSPPTLGVLPKQGKKLLTLIIETLESGEGEKDAENNNGQG